MARRDEGGGSGPVISIIGPGMQVHGDCVAEGTVRVEGEVRGTLYAGKAVVVGKEGKVYGEINTHDAVISGAVDGTITAASRLEIQASAVVDGQIRTRRMQLEEGAVMNAEVEMGEVSLDPPTKGAGAAARPGGAKGPGRGPANAVPGEGPDTEGGAASPEEEDGSR